MHNDPTVQKRNRKLLLLVLLPLVLLLAGTAAVWATLLSLNAAPPPAGEEAAPAALTNFTDDLGVSSDLQFTTTEVPRSDLTKGSLVLVNRETVWPFPELELANVYESGAGSYQLSGTGLELQAGALDSFNKMMESFTRITGVTQVMVAECYRSESEQTALYNNTLDRYGEAETDAFVAKPGYSEFHTGYALSLSLITDDGTVMDFTGDDDCDWLLRNCSRFGFVLRYPEGKAEITGYDSQPYHLRYVGKPHAYLMNLKGYCLEEYLEYLEHYTFGGSHVQITDNENQQYEIYYVPATEDTTNVPVPLDKEYVISGDNRNGFIVTVKL